MPYKIRVSILFLIVLTALLTISSANAQQSPESPTVGVCLPGAGYASGCAVDQDGDIDIFDIQLTAGRWDSSGVYTSGHTHWGETWTGASGSQGLRLEHTAGSGFTYGVYGLSASSEGIGVAGWTTATSGSTIGVYGRSNSAGGSGVYGAAVNAGGTNYGVYGLATASTGSAIGVYGVTGSDSGYGGYFVGQVGVLGNFTASGTKSFLIDHPLDPANQYLYHYSLEGPAPFNLYRGTVTMDSRGEARVELPACFEAINTDFSYQLTAIGAAMPNLHVAREVQHNTFQIAGGVAGMKASWQVTAVRNDAWVRDHGIQTETAKPEAEQGVYLYPEGYGQPAQLRLDYQRDAGRVERSQAQEAANH